MQDEPPNEFQHSPPTALPPSSDARVATPVLIEGGAEIAIPIARPVTPPYARPKDTRYPMLDLRPLPALGDLAAVTVGLFAGQLLLGPFAEMLIEANPEYGPFLFNTLLGVMALTAVGLVLYNRRQGYATIGLNRSRPGIMILAGVGALPACYFAVMVAAVGYMVLFQGNMETIVEERQVLLEMAPKPNVATILLFAVFTGFHEEVLFRGFLLTRMTALCKSRIAGIILSSLIFGLAHSYQGGLGVLQTAALGLVFCGLVTLMRSIWPAIIAHALFNGINLSLMPLLKEWIEPLAKHAPHV